MALLLCYRSYPARISLQCFVLKMPLSREWPGSHGPPTLPAFTTVASCTHCCPSISALVPEALAGKLRIPRHVGPELGRVSPDAWHAQDSPHGRDTAL